MTQPTKRVEYIDVARALGVMRVVVVHVLVLFITRPIPLHEDVFQVVRFFYVFTMPLFFFMSGMMYRPHGWSHVVIGSLTLIILAEITHICGMLAGGLVHGDWPGIYSTLRTMVGLSSFSIGVTWFLVALAFVRLLGSGCIDFCCAA